MTDHKFNPFTVGDLKRALAAFDDSLPVVVDGYEGGLSTPSSPKAISLRTFSEDDVGYYGAHDSDAYPHYRDEPHGPIVPAVYLSRGGGYRWEGQTPEERNASD